MVNSEMAYSDVYTTVTILKCSQLKLSVTIEIKLPVGLLAVVLNELSELNVLN